MRSRKGEGLFPRLLKLSHNNWLRQVRSWKWVFLSLIWTSFAAVWFSHQMKAATVEVRLKIKQNEMYHRYLLQVLFTPATQAARQAACTIVEALTTIPSRKQQVLDLLTR